MAQHENAVGWKVSVYWEDDLEWYNGKITKYSPSAGYYVEYDDGEEQWENVPEDNLKFIENTKEAEVAGEKSSLVAMEDSDVNVPNVLDAFAEMNEDEMDIQVPEMNIPKMEDNMSVVSSVHSVDQVPPSPVSSLASSLSYSESPKKQYAQLFVKQKAIPKPPKNSAVFFYDRETLLEKQRVLELDIEKLLDEKKCLAFRVKGAAQYLKSLKHELEALQAQSTLSNLDHKNTPTKKSLEELILDKKLINRQLSDTTAQLETQVHEARRRVAHTRQQYEALKRTYKNIPKHLRTSTHQLEEELTHLQQTQEQPTKFEHANIEDWQKKVLTITQQVCQAKLDRDHWKRLYNQEHYSIQLLQQQVETSRNCQ